MTDTIEVYRGDGSRRGSNVIETLLSDAVLITRGVAEMDANATQFNTVTLGVVLDKRYRLGQLGEVSDPSSALMYRAKVTSISISVADTDVTMSIGLERPI